MSYGYLQNYIPILLMFSVLVLMAGALLLLSFLFGGRKRSRGKSVSIESRAMPDEIASRDAARSAVSFRFLRLTIVFILFSVVAVFLYPWAVVFHQLRMYGFLAMLSFLLLVAPGYVYLWRKGVFDLAQPEKRPKEG